MFCGSRCPRRIGFALTILHLRECTTITLGFVLAQPQLLIWNPQKLGPAFLRDPVFLNLVTLLYWVWPKIGFAAFSFYVIKLKKIPAFIVNTGYFYGCGGRTRTYDLRVMSGDILNFFNQKLLVYLRKTKNN